MLKNFIYFFGKQFLKSVLFINIKLNLGHIVGEVNVLIQSTNQFHVKCRVVAESKYYFYESKLSELFGRYFTNRHFNNSNQMVDENSVDTLHSCCTCKQNIDGKVIMCRYSLRLYGSLVGTIMRVNRINRKSTTK